MQPKEAYSRTLALPYFIVPYTTCSLTRSATRADSFFRLDRNGDAKACGSAGLPCSGCGCCCCCDRTCARISPVPALQFATKWALGFFRGVLASCSPGSIFSVSNIGSLPRGVGGTGGGGTCLICTFSDWFLTGEFRRCVGLPILQQSCSQ